MKRVLVYVLIGFIAGAWTYSRAIQPTIDQLVYDFNFANSSWDECVRKNNHVVEAKPYSKTDEWVVRNPKLKKWEQGIPIIP